MQRGARPRVELRTPSRADRPVPGWFAREIRLACGFASFRRVAGLAGYLFVGVLACRVVVGRRPAQAAGAQPRFFNEVAGDTVFSSLPVERGDRFGCAEHGEPRGRRPHRLKMKCRRVELADPGTRRAGRCRHGREDDENERDAPGATGGSRVHRRRRYS